MNKEEIIKTQEKIEAEIGANVHPDATPSIKIKLENLSTYLSNASICISEAKRIQLTYRRKWLRDHAERIKDLSPSVIKEYLNTACIDEEILYIRCERNYSALVHSIDALRSLLSIAKAELTLN